MQVIILNGIKEFNKALKENYGLFAHSIKVISKFPTKAAKYSH